MGRASRSNPQTGGCVNILLDDVVADYATAFTNVIAPALRIGNPDKVVDSFADTCNPASAHASASDKAHITAHGHAREHAVEVLRSLDKQYLGGVLHLAEATLSPLLTRVETRRSVQGSS